MTPPRLLVIETKTGFVSRFVGRAQTRVVQIDHPDQLGHSLYWLDNFRQTGYVEDPTAPEAA